MSPDCVTTLQPGQQSETLLLKQKTKKEKKEKKRKEKKGVFLLPLVYNDIALLI